MEDLMRAPKKRAFGSLEDEDDSLSRRPQDPLVASALEEEQAAKKAKKGGTAGQGPKGKKRKGLTLEEVEKLEGSTVQESKVGMAASRRADKRKQSRAHEGTEMLAVGDLVDVEEALEHDEDDGVKLEPFNLARERQEGDFDEGGNYVERREEEDPTATDAWLTSEDAGVMSDEARRKIEAQKARMDRADAAPEITPRQVADLQRELITVLQPKETTMSALKRLRSRNAAPKRGGKQRQDEAKTEPSPEDKEAMALFDKLTELASTLMDAGELDIYGIPREELQRLADRHPAETDDFDMFGDGAATAAAAAGPAERIQEAAVSNGTPSGGPAAVPIDARDAQPAAAQAEVDYSSWPVKELTRFLRERGHDPAGITDKADLVAKVVEVANHGPEGEQPTAPPGYAFDPASGFFFNREEGMFWDATSGGYYTPADGKWWSFDQATGQFLEMQAAA